MIQIIVKIYFLVAGETTPGLLNNTRKEIEENFAPIRIIKTR